MTERFLLRSSSVPTLAPFTLVAIALGGGCGSKAPGGGVATGGQLATGGASGTTTGGSSSAGGSVETSAAGTGGPFPSGGASAGGGGSPSSGGQPVGGTSTGGAVSTAGGGAGGASAIGGSTASLADLAAWYTAMDASKGAVDLFADDISYLRGLQATLSGGVSKYYTDSSNKWANGWVQNWKSASDKMSWNITSTITGDYDITALIQNSSGADITVQVGTNIVTARGTDGWDKVELGTVSIPAGKSTLTLSASGSFNMALYSLELVPAAVKDAIDVDIKTRRSTSTWMGTNPLGMMYQWGSWGGKPDGTASPWPQCYANMNWSNFADRIKNEGADFIVWSITWTQYYVAA